MWAWKLGGDLNWDLHQMNFFSCGRGFKEFCRWCQIFLLFFFLNRASGSEKKLVFFIREKREEKGEKKGFRLEKFSKLFFLWYLFVVVVFVCQRSNCFFFL